MVAGTPLVSPTLVGRRAELSALISAVTGAPAVVSVEGEAGVGKTRVASAACVTGHAVTAHSHLA